MKRREWSQLEPIRGAGKHGPSNYCLSFSSSARCSIPSTLSSLSSEMLGNELFGKVPLGHPTYEIRTDYYKFSGIALEVDVINWDIEA